jgi:lipoprotein NlpD
VKFIAIKHRLDLSSTRALLAAVGLALLVSGCNTNQSGTVQVVDRNFESAPRQPVRSGQYIVQRGDTLYGIAFRFGWDWKALAIHNRIPAPYTIVPGQRIQFGGGTVVRTTPAKVAPAKVVRPSVAPPPAPKVAPVVVAPSIGIPAKTPVQSVARSSTGWAWPAKGTVIGLFSSNGSLNKGIDLAGELGEPVLAASDGTVVYAGSGLRGYGELVIIKHSETYVSAYGHNRRLLVQEGQRVKVGQMIGEMGSTGTDRVKLHFEIRRQGKPVDPIQYLPSR